MAIPKHYIRKKQILSFISKISRRDAKNDSKENCDFVTLPEN